jgi:hypothetical protein
MKIATLCIVLFLAGCQNDGDKAVNKILDYVEYTGQAIPVVYEQSQRSCMLAPEPAQTETCIAEIRSAFKPLIEALDQIRSVWCSFVPEECK